MGGAAGDTIGLRPRGLEFEPRPPTRMHFFLFLVGRSGRGDVEEWHERDRAFVCGLPCYCILCIHMYIEGVPDWAISFGLDGMGTSKI